MSHSAVDTVCEVLKLLRTEGPISIVECALHLGRCTQTMRTVLEEIEANGIAVVEQGPKTRQGPRIKLYSISPAWRGQP